MLDDNLEAVAILHERSNTATGKLLADMIDAARKRSGVITNFRINLRIGGMRMFFLDFLLSADGGAYANLVSSHEMIV